ncbi:2-isopropylmalate synthase 2 (Alpha-isopropylmalate synthase 2) (Alpha-IPM synthetase 2) [Cupriavidus taiwanensis]|uniref:2-isopropylmalate synthase n=1 Tax=Cupriavidus taiwanensis TaxID=164546 RepID=A0A976G4V2_9BURK|nr:2-isopropylmalate synthase [Cupriavidus taiwanensis]SOZ67913.1 2-isopropylmalate synthase 2 (Alpha-isopropylmalate synthase 2) (Alpha-IPM synthetase 2) [Cupriavidus taiwanensis]SOZ68879.1 2-isopropylmalate synthase 2 (Alpha-isopropylmalate synthase 2) (Alpha-IPM synthetase 2) [Cupriavidus taiwanensis]SOZ72532.1 2-isopropylmalate synthase 2 (Alpha-isopropylmalate synthase 2) (Alpha-IPM synthetase 2) [Cupriavidus taiwanensis]SPA09527.1 2-isopropylmalate synthase 2 (Alpha-isopropylmalate syntha
MLFNPTTKYRPAATVDLPDRTWPGRTITRAPRWMSTDLRDGNQALIEPMNPARKLRFFEQLVKIGLKEIEVAFPAASQTDFDFVRMLIEARRIPDDVTIVVLTQSREDLIRRTVESVRGAARAIVHLYNPIAPAWRRIVFNASRDEIKEVAVAGTRLIKALTDAMPETAWTYEYSPETFSLAELDFSLEVSDAVSAAWQAGPGRPMILNLPTTVECSTPNVFADQIEWMHRRLARREHIALSVHPHNDRGTAAAAAELALMAGADRVEGCLFGNGERTGNVDLVTLALNLYTQGVAPQLDFSDIDAVRQCVEHCNQLPVHPRHPYVGDLVFTAFSGSHQDAIRKGFAQQQPDAIWEVPYLPIDPADLGRSYDAVIRVNSQSGKGGMAYLLEQVHGLYLPRRLQIEFSRAVQALTDDTGLEASADDLYGLFQREYLAREAPLRYVSHQLASDSTGATVIAVQMERDGQPCSVRGSGNGPIDAFIDALELPVRVMDYHEHAMNAGADARAACYVEVRVGDSPTGFGAGIDANLVTASLRAVLSGVNRHLQAGFAAGARNTASAAVA